MEISQRLPALVTNTDGLLSWAKNALSDVGFSPKMCNRIAVVIEEIFVNICSYAYPNGAGDAYIQLSWNGKTLRLTFEDSGVPFNPLEKPDKDLPKSVDDLTIGGFGIHIAKKCMDTLSYEYRDGKNVLTMTKE
jgi:anti-sigma regulatory factor (Ser/Thr protein kinase)